MRGLGFYYTNPEGTGGSRVCVLVAVVLGEWVGGLGQGLGGWCGVKSVFVVSLFSLC